MTFADFAREDSIVLDYEKAAQEIFPLMLKAETPFLQQQYAIAFGSILGNPGEFYQYLTGSSGERLIRIERLVKMFRQNIELLVKKTWVEKSDEKRKTKLIDALSGFSQEFLSGKIDESLRSFISIAHDIAYLLFGEQSRNGDFIEYTFRIEPKLGLFWWFVSQIERDRAAQNRELAKIEVLLGIYFLASF
jgi:hypothetical protein